MHILKRRSTFGLLFFGALALGLWYLHSIGVFPDFSMIKMYRMDVEAYLMQNLFAGVLIFALVYIAAVGLSIPIATPLTILSGFLFGNILGTGIVAISASVGATIALVLIRFFFYEDFKTRFAHRLEKVNREMTGHGFRDIFILRLTPIVPFALINIGAALTDIKTRSFFLATLIGVVPFTFVYVNAGTQIAMIESPGDIISLPVILGISLLVLVASLPLVIHRRGRSTPGQSAQ